MDVHIDVPSEHGSKVNVRGRFSSTGSVKNRRNLSFLRSYLGFGGLGERVSGLTLKDDKGNVVAFQSPVPGEFVADSEIAEWSYSIDLSPRNERNAAAHISWLAGESGILMLGDILPRFEAAKDQAARIAIDLPVGWRADPPIRSVIISELDASVFYVGRDIVSWRADVPGSRLNFHRFGSWQFTDKDLSDAASEIFNEYKLIFGGGREDANIAIVKFPVSVPTGQWQAETRGRNITIVSSDMPSAKQSVQRLHEQLRHEMFHLWIPNDVALSGSYDWFFEGFALYQSLKTGVLLDRIRFADFLDTLSRAKEIDARQTNRLSLIEASNKRWNGLETYVYARGMVTAFLCDVLLQRHSKGKRSIRDVFHDLFAKHRHPNTRTDGYSAVLAILNLYPELSPIVESCVKGSGLVDWRQEIASIGLEEKNGLSVKSTLTGKQTDLLEALGYNRQSRLVPNIR